MLWINAYHTYLNTCKTFVPGVARFSCFENLHSQAELLFLQQHARPYDIEHHAEALGMGYFITTDLQIILLFDVTHQTHPAILHF